MNTNQLTTKEQHIQRDQSWIDKATETLGIIQLSKFYQEREKQLKDELKVLSLGVSSTGGNFEFTRVESKGKIDYNHEQIQKLLKKIDLEQYRGPVVARWTLKYTGIMTIDKQ